MEKLGAVILAAGMSTRMGDFKQLLKIDGVSLIRRVYDMMRSAGAEDIVVVTGFRAGDIRAELAGERVIFVNNDDYATTQQLESLRLGIAALMGRCGRIIVSPADVPLVLDATVEKLLSEDAPFIRPVYNGKAGHPVVFSAELARIVNSFDGDGGLRGAVESAGVEIKDVPVDDIAVTMDSDTPDDFEALIKLYNGRK